MNRIYIVILTIFISHHSHSSQTDTSISSSQKETKSDASQKKLISINFTSILNTDKPQDLKITSYTNKLARQEWDSAIASTSIKLRQQWADILQHKNSGQISTSINRAFAPMATIFLPYPWKNQSDFLYTQSVIRQLFLDTHELAHKDMNVHALLQDAAQLPEADDDLITSLQEDTILTLLKQNKLFSCKKHRMLDVTEYYLTPIGSQIQNKNR